MIPEESRFESDPCAVLDDDRPTAGPALPEGWRLDVPDVASADDVAALTRLLRDHERHGRGWASASAADVEVEIAGLRTRENLVVRDAEDLVRAWGSVHDRASGRMLLVHVDDAADGDAPLPVGALVGSASAGSTSTYVAYVGVRAAARGRGVARGLLTTVVADAAARGRDSVALEVDADSTTGADALYRSLGWRTSYATWSWHRHVTTTDA
ncbi:GNAT family N-acetyltransferase [Nocardioides sp. TRM66260-LWL]|uniref:GNAT family N-acetyltransferase n=1 Tax=Nocardioides sp. TRM66260-LWL TaxID=2874478 RepID=UPI001CC49CFF|nr:GNAT family N-acetyltransferase [Nocardioides sp. TRM66260-LWL]MBZ5734854.1 GNAT family N-acetyltransferase [Nocardioides sp. TRM66260-LWL]